VTSPLFEPGYLGGLTVRNRFIRAATSEAMAAPDGSVTPPLLELHEALARGGVGTSIVGHLYCHPRGRYAPGHLGIHDDAMIAGLAALTERIRRHGARAFAQLTHAGSQTRLTDVTPLAPSPVPNPLTHRRVGAANEDDIEEVIRSFADAAARAVEAGFDGVHVHAGNGYLLSEFCSPLTNHREDHWGGSPARRSRLLLSVLRSIRKRVPEGFPVTLKLGMLDSPPGGLRVDESLETAGKAVAIGIDAVEPSVNLMSSAADSARKYVGVGPGRAIRDLLPLRILAKPEREAYFLFLARALRRAVETKIILVGGMRTTDAMVRVLAGGDADFIAMSRPFIRQPDLVIRIAEGEAVAADCTSCNLCLTHSGHHTLRCWRVPRRRLLQHALYKLRGGLRREFFGNPVPDPGSR
jgi:2,4-dienoyl-CoA reductase-like NADH-dependent reductase (Old Yellow Enzyme family)